MESKVSSGNVQVLNLVKEIEVEAGSATGPSSFHISSRRGFRVRKVVQGLGVLYFYWAGGGVYSGRTTFNKSLFMPHPTPLRADASSKSGEPSLIVSIPELFPCAGAVSPELGGFLTAPTVKLDVAEGKDIAAMLIAPHPATAHVSLGKSSLSIEAHGSSAQMQLTSNGQLDCEGTLSGEFQSAKLLLTRNSNPPISDLGLVEELVEAKEPGPVNASWKPVTRSFEELLFVFRPVDVNLGDLDDLVEHVGASTETFDEAGKTPFIIGDGGMGSYSLKLVLKGSQRNDASDEAQVIVG